MARVLVIHGAGMEMRGKVQVDVFGTMTLPEYDVQIRKYAKELSVEVEIFHSNIEGEVISKLHDAQESGVDAAIINPAGYTCGHPALAAVIAQVGFPTVELHVSNPARRGVISDIARSARCVIAGYGVFGYYLALRGVLEIAKGQ